MNEQQALQQYMEICWRLYQRLERDNAWPWGDDSPNQEDLVELDDNNKQL